MAWRKACSAAARPARRSLTGLARERSSRDDPAVEGRDPLPSPTRSGAHRLVWPGRRSRQRGRQDLPRAGTPSSPFRSPSQELARPASPPDAGQQFRPGDLRGPAASEPGPGDGCQRGQPGTRVAVLRSGSRPESSRAGRVRAPAWANLPGPGHEATRAMGGRRTGRVTASSQGICGARRIQGCAVRCCGRCFSLQTGRCGSAPPCPTSSCVASSGPGAPICTDRRRCGSRKEKAPVSQAPGTRRGPGPAQPGPARAARRGQRGHGGRGARLPPPGPAGPGSASGGSGASYR